MNSNKRLKIGIVCYPSVGGSGVVGTELGHELASRGHEVHFITYEIPFRLRMEEKNIYFHEVSVSEYDLFKYPDYALTLAVKIAQVSKCWQLDVLHVHYAIPHATSAYLAKEILNRKPKERPFIVTTLHGTDITLVGAEPFYLPIVKFSIEKSCKVTAVSAALKEETEKLFSLKKPIEVIYNFFSPKKEWVGNKQARNEFVKGDEKLILHSSNFRPIKRPLDLLRIFQKIQMRLPAKLLLLGSGPGVEEIRQEATRLDLVEHLYFLGQSRDIDPYIAASDLFLLPSSQESFGLAALESLAYGVPVVASGSGGLPEVIENGKTGFYCQTGDIEGMANAAVTLLTNPELYQTFSDRAKVSAQRFYPDRIVPLYEAIYQSTCS